MQYMYTCMDPKYKLVLQLINEWAQGSAFNRKTISKAEHKKPECSSSAAAAWISRAARLGTRIETGIISLVDLGRCPPHFRLKLLLNLWVTHTQKTPTHTHTHTHTHTKEKHLYSSLSLVYTCQDSPHPANVLDNVGILPLFRV